MSGVRVPDVLVATLAGLGVVMVVDALGGPFTLALVRAGMYDVSAAVQAVVSIVAAAAGAAAAVVVHERRLAPGTATNPLTWLVVGLPTALALVVLALVGLIGVGGWPSAGQLLVAFGVQVLVVAVGAAAALVTGAVLRSRSAARTPAVPAAAPH